MMVLVATKNTSSLLESLGATTEILAAADDFDVRRTARHRSARDGAKCCPRSVVERGLTMKIGFKIQIFLN
jgi:hypothetical protein